MFGHRLPALDGCELPELGKLILDILPPVSRVDPRVKGTFHETIPADCGPLNTTNPAGARAAKIRSASRWGAERLKDLRTPIQAEVRRFSLTTGIFLGMLLDNRQ